MVNKTKQSDKEQDYDLITELVSVRRTAKVVKGGRIFRFSATVVVGDGVSQVGIGIGHGLEVPVAIQKAQKQAKKSGNANLIERFNKLERWKQKISPLSTLLKSLI